MANITTETAELQEALVEVRKRKFKRKIISISVVALIILITIGMIWFYGYNYAKNTANIQIEELRNQIYKLENTPVVVDPVTPEIVQSVISSKISEISELASAEYVFTNAAKFTDTKNIVAIFDWMTEKSFVQKWDGVIKAGINLNNISIKVTDSVVTITLPQAEILSYEVDYDSVEILDEKNNLFNPITIEDKAGFDRETSESMKQRAIENGLLEKATKSAEGIITALLFSSLDSMHDYTIEFVYVSN